MRATAVKGFSGFLNGKPFSMHAGETREVEDCETIQELLHITYLMVDITPAPQAEPESADTAEEAPAAPDEITDTPDEVKLNEDKRGKSKRN